MAKYSIESAYGSVFGMDVHARSITVKGFDWPTGEMHTKTFTNCPTPADIAAWMHKRFTEPYYAAYESGCTGFHLAKELRALGIDCDVIAISSVARSTDDKLRKNDKRDANRLLAELISPKKDYSVVWIPDAECEAMRDLVRARLDAVWAVKRAKQQASNLLMRYGHIWNEKTTSGKSLKKTWGVDYEAWLKTRKFEEATDHEVLMVYKRMVDEGIEFVDYLERQVIAQANKPRWKPYVDAFVLLKGIDVQTAFLLAVEFGDFHRFRNGRGVSAWLGTVPKEDSSGPKVVRGHITKAGNSHLRRALVEGIQNISRFKSDAVKPARGCVVSTEVLAHARAANARLSERYHHLADDEKIGINKAKVAVVSELVRWVWAIGCMVQDEQAARSATQ